MHSPLIRLILALVLWGGVSATSFSQEVDINGITPAGWNRLWDQAMAKSGGRAQPDGQVWVIEVPSERAVYFFTTPLHPAHPSIVRRARVEGDKGAFVQTVAWTDGAPVAFEAWLAALLKPKQN